MTRELVLRVCIIINVACGVAFLRMVYKLDRQAKASHQAVMNWLKVLSEMRKNSL